MNITTVKSNAGEYDVLVDGERYDTIERQGRHWFSHGDSTVNAATLSKALDSIVWSAVCEHSAVRSLQRRTSHFATSGNSYMADLFNARHFAKAHHLFDTIRPGVK